MIIVPLLLLVVALVLLICAILTRPRGEPPRRARAAWGAGERGAALAALTLAALPSVAPLVVPVYSTASGAVAASPAPAALPRDGATLLDVSGPRVLAPLLVPIVIAALPLAFRATRLRVIAEALASTLLAAFAILGGFSIGLYYVPSAVAILVATLLGLSARRAATRAEEH